MRHCEQTFMVLRDSKYGPKFIKSLSGNGGKLTIDQMFDVILSNTPEQIEELCSKGLLHPGVSAIKKSVNVSRLKEINTMKRQYSKINAKARASLLTDTRDKVIKFYGELPSECSDLAKVYSKQWISAANGGQGNNIFERFKNYFLSLHEIEAFTQQRTALRQYRSLLT